MIAGDLRGLITVHVERERIGFVGRLLGLGNLGGPFLVWECAIFILFEQYIYIYTFYKLMIKFEIKVFYFIYG